MEAYSVFASLNLRGDALKKMELFTLEVKKATEMMIVLRKSVAIFDESAALNMSKFNSNLTIAAGKTDILNSKLIKLSSELRAIGNQRININGNFSDGMRGHGYGGRGGSHGGSHIGARTALTGVSMVSPETASIAAGTALGGAAVGAAAVGGVLTVAGFRQQSSIERQKLQLRGSGLTEAQLKEASVIANTPQKGLSPLNIMSSLNDAFMATRDWNEAKKLAPLLAKAEFAGKATFTNMTDAQRQALVKFAEMRAGGDMSAIDPAMNLGYKMYNASAGTLDPKQQAQFMKHATTYGYHLSDRGYAGMEPVLQEFTGMRTGTGLQSGFQQLATGAGTLNNKKRVADLLKLHIYKAAKFDRNGRPTETTIDPGLLKLYETDPVAFTKKIMSIYEQHGTKTPESMNRRFALDFPRLTAQVLSLIMKNLPKIDRQLALYDSLPGIDSAFQQTFKIPSGKVEELANAWHTMATAFGELTSPTVMKGMDFLIKSLQGWTEFFKTGFGAKISENTGQIPQEIQEKMTGKPKFQWGDIFKVWHSDDKSAANDVGGARNYQYSSMRGDVFLDKRKVGDVVWKDFADRSNPGGVIGGQSGANRSYSPMPSSVNSFGTP